MSLPIPRKASEPVLPCLDCHDDHQVCLRVAHSHRRQARHPFEPSDVDPRIRRGAVMGNSSSVLREGAWRAVARARVMAVGFPVIIGGRQVRCGLCIDPSPVGMFATITPCPSAVTEGVVY